ncbi:MAG: clostripain-related cysteine peptidase [Candidatus Muiribacteriota bacterium]
MQKVKKMLMLSMLFVFIFLITGCDDVVAQLDKDPQRVIDKIEKNHGPLSQESENREWAVMIYGSLDIEPQLEKAMLQELIDMVEIGDADGKAHLIAQIDFRNAKYIPSKRYYIRENELVVRGEFPNKNMGDPRTFEDFLNWALEYPADNRMLFVLGHGTGWISVDGPDSITADIARMGVRRNSGINNIDISNLRTPESFYPPSLYKSKQNPRRSFAYDHTQEDCISLNQSTSVLDRVLGNDRIDIIAFRSCLMNQVETAYQFAKHFDYFVGSQTSQYGVAEGILTTVMGISNLGFDTAFLSRLKDSSRPVSPEQMAKHMYSSIKNTNKKIIQNVSDLELTAECIDLRALRRAVPSLNELGYIIRKNLENSRTRDEMVAMLTEARGNSEKFGGLFQGVYTENSGDYEYEYIDLGMFMKYLASFRSNNIAMHTIRDHAQRVQAMIDRAGLAQYASNHNFNGVRGGGVTSIFMFPNSNEKLVKIYNRLMSDKYAQLDFNRDSEWNKMLDVYYSHIPSYEGTSQYLDEIAHIVSGGNLGQKIDGFETDTQQEETQEEFQWIAYIDVKAANIRKGPGTNNEIIDTLHRHTKVDILENVGKGWVKVKVLNGAAKGTVGYIAGTLLSLN